eukprot:gene7484-15322_t
MAFVLLLSHNILNCGAYMSSRRTNPRNNIAKYLSTESSLGVSDIPTNLPSVKGIDYVPLATMLAIGDFKGADQFTRDTLIQLAGPESVKRGFVYWTDVQDIPSEDLVTMEKLWLKFSGGNFGYSIQKRVWDVERGDFDNFIRRVGWTKMDNGSERKLKWFPPNEFIYDVEKAPKGHLPLTSALRGTQLMKQLMAHPQKVYTFTSHIQLSLSSSTRSNDIMGKGPKKGTASIPWY